MGRTHVSCECCGAEGVADEGVDDPLQGQPPNLNSKSVRCEAMDDGDKERQGQEPHAEHLERLQAGLAEAGLEVEDGAEECRERCHRPIPDPEDGVADECMIDQRDSCAPYHQHQTLPFEFVAQLQRPFAVAPKCVVAWL